MGGCRATGDDYILGVAIGARASSLLLLVTLLTVLRPSSISAASDPGAPITPRVYCQWEKFVAICGPDEVIVMETANYGRMRLGRCIKFDLGFIGCTADVLPLADTECSGRRRCEIAVPNEHLDRVNPCLAELKSYFEASYRCQKVISADFVPCRTSKLVKVLPTTGFLSNAATTSTGQYGDCGSADSSLGPRWLIEGRTGQRINITLWDFGRRVSAAAGAMTSGSSYVDGQRQRGQSSMPAGCTKYATLTETGAGGGGGGGGGGSDEKIVCGAGRVRDQAAHGDRIRLVYTSIGSSLEIQLNAVAYQTQDGTSSSAPHFLLEYQVVGCPDLSLADNAWFRRQGDVATIGCHSASGATETWKLTCSGGTWVGETGVCKPESDALQVLGTFKFPSGSSVVIIVSISLLIGILILTCGLVCLCRRRQRNASRSELSGSRALDIDGCSYNSSRLVFAHKAAGGGAGLAPGGVTGGGLLRGDAGPVDRRDVAGRSTGSSRYDRESNEYASIWEWPLPTTPINGPGDADIGKQQQQQQQQQQWEAVLLNCNSHVYCDVVDRCDYSL